MATHSHDVRISTGDEHEPERLVSLARAAIEAARAGEADDACAQVVALVQRVRAAGTHGASSHSATLAQELRGVEAELDVECCLCTVKARGADERLRVAIAALLERLPTGTVAEARAQHVQGITLARLTHYTGAVSSLCRALDGYRLLDGKSEMAQVEDTLGMVHAARGRFDLAAAAYARSIARKLLVADKKGLAITLGNLGRAHLEERRFDDALACFELDMALSREVGDALGIVRMSIDLAAVLRELKRHDEARQHLEYALPAARALCQWRLVFDALRQAALLALAENRRDEALLSIQAARALGADREGGLFAASCDETLGWIRIAAGELEGRDLVVKAIDFYCQHGKIGREIATRLELVQHLVQHGFRAEAERHLWKAAERAERDGFAFHRRRIRELYVECNLVPHLPDDREKLEFDSRQDTDDSQSYIKLEKLGAGGFGDVYRAYDPVQNRLVALKILRLEELYDRSQRAAVRNMVQAEFQAANAAQHPGIARVFAIGKDERGLTYVAQEFVQGHSLAAEIKTGPPDIVYFADVLWRIAAALAELHHRGVEHRDLKPENVMLRAANKRPVLIDFGIAHTPMAGLDERTFAGTPAYMAPERILRRPSGPPADLYALGVLARVWLGVPLPTDLVFDPDKVKQVSWPPIGSAVPHLPEDLSALLDLCVASDPLERPSAHEMCEALTDWLQAHGRS